MRLGEAHRDRPAGRAGRHRAHVRRAGSDAPRARRTARHAGHARDGTSSSACGCRRVRAVSTGARCASDNGVAVSRNLTALHASGRRDRPRAGRPQRRRHHADGVGEDALLQRAHPQRDPAGSRRAAALYLFPTKALAQDQLAELQGLCETIASGSGEQIGVFTYDGDTPQDARRTIRARAHLVLSNPDMVHAGILPHHPRWAKLFENLRYVVIDELHAYRGVFGSHLCNVLRRLRRICRHYGSNPVFFCSSATIANPRELAERLAEQPFELVDQSGAPRGEKFFRVRQPAGREPSARASAARTSAKRGALRPSF